MIHLHRLRLTGPRRQYNIDFDRRGSNLAIIAGPIHTGKTTILELVDYLFGDDEHPTHPELAATVRSAALELSFDGRRMTIERPLFEDQQVAYVHEGGLDDTNPVQRKIINPPGDPEALSAFLLGQIGLDHTKVRVTDGNPNSPTNDLSIRDVMGVAYLPSRRLDNQALVYENHPQKQYKLRQVIEVIFGVHDDRLAQLLAQLTKLRDERREYEREVAALETFLHEEDVPSAKTIARLRDEASVAAAHVEERLLTVTRQASSTTDYAATLRGRYGSARAAALRAGAQLRDREALIERLLPLRAQYAEDERKLVFFDEAKQLFDPLHVSHCPACLQRLEEPPSIADGNCTLCSSELHPSEEIVFAFDRERRALKRRIKDLDSYTNKVQQQILDARRELERREAAMTAVAEELDARTAQDLSPYVAQRDALLEEKTSLDARLADLRRAERWTEGLERRRGQVVQTTTRMAEVSEMLDTLRADQPDRDTLVNALTERFASLLRAWGFPKVDDVAAPYVDEKFVPFVRGRAYREIGSDGAQTLIAVAWTLSVFELAVELGAKHPGFLMIDGPQKNLSPRADRPEDEYMDPAIVARMYEHLVSWTDAHPDAQIIIVDHEPPPPASKREVVRFTRRADHGRYGLIEDQTE